MATALEPEAVCGHQLPRAGSLPGVFRGGVGSVAGLARVPEFAEAVAGPSFQLLQIW